MRREISSYLVKKVVGGWCQLPSEGIPENRGIKAGRVKERRALPIEGGRGREDRILARR